MNYGYFKDLPRSVTSDRVLQDDAFNVTKIQNMINVKVELIQWSAHFFGWNLATHAVKAAAKPSGDAIKIKVIFQQQVAK